MKKATVTVDLRYYWSSIEKAEVGIESPSGKKIWIMKIRVQYYATEEQRALWEKITEEAANFSSSVMELTYAEMRMLLEMSKFKRGGK